MTSSFQSVLDISDDDPSKDSKPLENEAVGDIQCDLPNNFSKHQDVAEKSNQPVQLSEDLPPREFLLFMLNEKNSFFLRRYKQGRHIEDLDQAISALQEVIKLTPESDESLPNELACLGQALLLRFERTEQLEDITGAIDLLREAAFHTQNIPEKSHARLDILNSLSVVLYNKFSYTRQRNDIDEAIDVAQDLADNTRPECPKYSLSSFNNLSSFLTSRFQYCGGDLNDIVRAIEVQRKVIDNWPDDRLSYTILGNAHGAYFMQTRELSHIDMAIEALRKVLSLVDSGEDILSVSLANLGKRLGERFVTTGNIDDLEEAIALELRAIQLCSDDHPLKRKHYSNLGILFYYRSSVTGDIHDIHECTRAHREALLRTPPGHVDLPASLNWLGSSMERLFHITGSETELSEAISFYRKAVNLDVHGSFTDMTYLNDLGGALCSRYQLSHQRGDLDDGISALRKSVTLSPPGHARLPVGLARLSYALEMLFNVDRQSSIIDEAISAMEWAIGISVTSEGNSELPSLLGQLGGLFLIRYQATHSENDIQRAVSLYREATQIPDGLPLNRIKIGQLWGKLCVTIMDLEQAFEAFQLIFNDVVPQLAWIGRPVEQRYLLLTALANFVSEATAVAIRHDQFHMAMEWLEQGRSIVWSQVTSLRTPLEDIRRVDAVLCEELKRTGTALQEASMRTSAIDSVGGSMPLNVSIQDDARRHQHLAKQWDFLLSRVRNLPGLEEFLRPTPFNDLVSSLPTSGFVIVVNIDPFSCDALVLTRFMTAGILHVPLPRFYERAVSLRENLYDFLYHPAARMRNNRKGRLAAITKVQFSIKDLLKELWYEIVKPIFDALQLQPTPNPPRIWWCPTGPLAFLPLHAAGDYDNDTSCASNIMEYTLSSYTPTITALTQGLSKHQRQTHEFKGMLAVSEPEPPGLPPIPSTEVEIQTVEKIFDSHSLSCQCIGANATAKDVLTAMPLRSWIHLSCHALQNDTPLDSAFYLHDGPLTLGDIMQHPLPHAQFAFLSACETGKGDKKLSEEAIHLAAGMLAAGYTSVIATMWSISDGYAPFVAEEFYTHILKKGEEVEEYPDCIGAAGALHHSIRRFREMVGDDEEGLLLWVPYIHVGI